MKPKYPTEFLGRCATCLENAMLDDDPCSVSHLPGHPLRQDECMVWRAQKRYDRDHVFDVRENQ